MTPSTPFRPVSMKSGGETVMKFRHSFVFYPLSCWCAVCWRHRRRRSSPSRAPKLVGSGAIGDASQGTSVSFSADANTAIVGGPQDDRNNTTGEGGGAAWVYTRFAGTPGTAHCVGVSVQSLARQFGGLNPAA